jgi:hypothetical protein
VTLLVLVEVNIAATSTIPQNMSTSSVTGTFLVAASAITSADFSNSLLHIACPSVTTVLADMHDNNDEQIKTEIIFFMILQYF